VATVEAIARAALGDLAQLDTGLVLGERWVNERYSQLASRHRLKQRRRLGEVVIPAAITTGTVTATRGSDLVTGDATAAAAWSSTLVGRYFQVDSAWYEVQEVSGTTLKLAVTYAEDTAADASYAIVARTVALPTTVRHIASAMIHERYGSLVQGWTLSRLDRVFRERMYLTTGPAYFSEVGEAADGAKLLEFYPYSTTTEHVAYVYWEKPRVYSRTEHLPGAVDSEKLKQGVLVDVMRWRMAKAADAGNVELAALWRNEYRAQETVWKGVLQELIREDSGVDDTTFLVRSLGGLSVQPSAITDAHAEVIARGQRP